MALTWFVSGTALMLVFQLVVSPGEVRHHGLYFILYLACLWSSSTSQKPQPSPAASPTRLDRLFLPSLLLIQAVAGAYAWVAHYSVPFSTSKLAAEFIQKNGYARMLIAGSRELRVSPVAAYLDRPIYYVEDARYGTYFSVRSSKYNLPIPEVMFRVAQLATNTHRDVLLVLNDPIGLLEEGRDVVQMNSRGGPSENDTLYVVGTAKRPFTSAWLCLDGNVSFAPEPPAKQCLSISLLAQFQGATVSEDHSLYLIRQPR